MICQTDDDSTSAQQLMFDWSQTAANCDSCFCIEQVSAQFITKYYCDLVYLRVRNRSWWLCSCNNFEVNESTAARILTSSGPYFGSHSYANAANCTSFRLLQLSRTSNRCIMSSTLASQADHCINDSTYVSQRTWDMLNTWISSYQHYRLWL